MTRFKQNVLDRMNIADKLNKGQCDGTFAEAILILCSILNAIASRLWPEAKDHKRFVETLTEFSDSVYCVKRISLFLLLQGLIKNQEIKIGNKLRISFQELSELESDRLFSADEIDRYEDEIQQKVPEITRAKSRRYSYAHILYKEIRCGLVHEYRTGEYATFLENESQNTGICYSNIASRNKPIYHEICITYNWVKEVTLSILNNTHETIDKDIKLKEPSSWWIDG